MSNLCNSCTNIGCDFQSGIVRTNCVFYIPPHIEPDDCENYVVMQPTVNVLDRIRAEIEEHVKINQNLNVDRARALCWCLDVIDKYKSESEDQNADSN